MLLANADWFAQEWLPSTIHLHFDVTHSLLIPVKESKVYIDLIGFSSLWNDILQERSKIILAVGCECI